MSYNSLTLTGTLEHSVLSFNTRHELLCSADIKAKSIKSEAEGEARAPVDMVAVIDRSGSMEGDLELVKDTLEFMISKLKPDDQFSIVSFGSDVTVELQLTGMDSKGRAYAKTVAQRISISGCTNLSGGLFTGIDQLLTSKKPKNLKSVLLFTDGDANEGTQI